MLPVAFRHLDGIEPGQEFEIERQGAGEHRLTASEPPKNRGLVGLLRACPEKDWFAAIESEATHQIKPPAW